MLIKIKETGQIKDVDNVAALKMIEMNNAEKVVEKKTAPKKETTKKPVTKKVK